MNNPTKGKRKVRKTKKGLNRWKIAVILGVFLVLSLLVVVFKDSLSLLLYRYPKPQYVTKNIKLPQGYSVYGIDVSKYQGKIDWKAVKQQGVHFAFIKATEGLYKTDPLFISNWTKAKKNGIMRGAYHFYWPSSNPTAQAKHFIKNVKIQKGDLPPVLDIEHVGKHPKKDLIANLKRFIAMLEAHYGCSPIIYTYYKFYTNHLDSDFEAYPLWVAHYNTDKLNLHENKWNFWQFTEEAWLKGIGHKVDVNVFNGDIEDLNELAL